MVEFTLCMARKKIKITLPQFPSHVKISKNKSMKLGYNKIYAGINHFVREKTVRQIHEFVEAHVPIGLELPVPVGTHLRIYVPINYGNVRMVKGNITWKPPHDRYKPNWDLDNLAFIWLKSLNDGLVKAGILPDDTVEYLNSTAYSVHFVKTFEQRKLVYEIKYTTNDDKRV